MPTGPSTRPPGGFQAYCASQPEACVRTPAEPPVQLTEARFQLLLDVNWKANASIRYVTDSLAEGKSESWRRPKDVGDCEDYALLKREMLIERGWPRSGLLLAYARTPRKKHHIVLVVRTDKGDFVLDNKVMSRVLPWEALHYDWVSRQSPDDPTVWQRIKGPPTAGKRL